MLCATTIGLMLVSTSQPCPKCDRPMEKRIDTTMAGLKVRIFSCDCGFVIQEAIECTSFLPPENAMMPRVGIKRI